MTSAAGLEVAVAGPFEARIRVDGEDVGGCLADLPVGVLRKCTPVRTPGVYRRQRHMPGLWFSTTAGRFLEYESPLERDWMLLMDFGRRVEWICEQPLRLRYRWDGKPASHIQDLLVWRGGEPELCDVKSAERVDDPEFQAQVRDGAGVRRGWLGLPGARGARSSAAHKRTVAGRVPRATCGPGWGVCADAVGVGGRPVHDPELLSDALEPMVARPVLMHLLWVGRVLVDVGEPIEDESRVTAYSGQAV
ncbi:MAG: hypothetical protein ACLQBY_00200 [Solirubrobacteraceae bacterium]